MPGLPGKRSSKFDSETSVYERTGGDSEGSHLFDAMWGEREHPRNRRVAVGRFRGNSALEERQLRPCDAQQCRKSVSTMAGAAPESPIVPGQHRPGSRGA